MLKLCDCGQTMKLELRRLVYKRRTFISHVPVYACQHCPTYELMPLVKPDLLDYLNSLDGDKHQTRISFADIYEPVSILQDVLASYSGSIEEFQRCYKEAFEDRVNMLLDLYRFAKASNDTAWMDEIKARLEKVNAFLQLKMESSDFCAS
ncbi:hypothetical protein [Paenibacillus faecalis]|uniref:hypothetical protein n=1 Tax=Paenibacillus faecalis TaxID=2079532 RepID=UPI001F1BD656|nr:hypothetical protein [Paenibacillus faecalis]